MSANKIETVGAVFLGLVIAGFIILVIQSIHP